MLEAVADVEKLGARIVVIGNGSVQFLDDFASAYPDSITFLTDPERRAYRALSLQRGLGGVRAFSMLSSGWRAYRSGHRQAKVQGDPAQMGGVFVVATDGTFLFEQRSGTAGDHPNPQEILESLRPSARASDIPEAAALS